MKTIIREPNFIYGAECQHCKCVFTYSKSDVDVWFDETTGSVVCPGCGFYVDHSTYNIIKKTEKENERDN